MGRNLERITSDYWEVGVALNHPDSAALTAEDALGALRSSDMLRPTDWRLMELMHTLRYDIIEGNTGWRETRRTGTNSVSILHTKD